MSFYREISVLKRRGDNSVVRFICYECIETGEFCVASAETVSTQTDPASLAWVHNNRLQHIREGGLDQDWFPTLREALEGWPDNGTG